MFRSAVRTARRLLTKTGSRQKAQTVRPTRLGLESLEQRDLMSASSLLMEFAPLTANLSTNYYTLQQGNLYQETTWGVKSLLDTNVHSFAVGSLAGTNYLFDLNSSGVLKARSGSSWVTEDTRVQSFALGTFLGINDLFDLNSSGVLKETDGNGWVTKDTGVQSFAVGALGGTNYLFDLNSARAFKEYNGWFWSTQDTSVVSFAMESFNGTNYLIDLNTAGVLKDSSGSGWSTQDTGVLSFAVGSLNGTNYLFDLNTSGVLKGSSGYGWSTQDTGVTSFAMESLNGANYIIDLNYDGVLKASSGSGWYTQDTGVVSFAVGSLNGINYLFDLNTLGVLKASYGSGWYTQDTDVGSFAFGNFGGTNYVIDLNHAGVLKASSGSGWYTQDAGVQSFAVDSVRGTNYLCESVGGEIKYSNGSGWQTYSADAPGPFGAYQTPIANPAQTSVGGATYTDIVQGGGDTCWIDASIASLATSEDLSLRIYSHGNNWYSVGLYNRNNPADPTAGYHSEIQWVYFDGTRTDADLNFDANQPGESWMVVLQRAILQAVAEWDPSQSITAPHGGGPTDAQAILTGHWTANENLAVSDSNIKSDLLGALALGKNVVLVTQGYDAQGNSLTQTLVADHCYAVYAADDQNVWLYNPWGTLEEYSWDVITQDGSVFCVN
jgi:hypothetical protein